MKIKTRIEAAIIEYTGDGNFKLELVADPHVAGVYAAQVTMGDGHVWQMLWSKDEADSMGSDADAIEECDFDCWPPKQAKSGVGSWRIS